MLPILRASLADSPPQSDIRPYPQGRRSADTESVLVNEGLELLSEEEARRLLARGGLGRIGITIGAMPAIFPVTYEIVDDAIVFLTAPGSKLSAATEGAVVAFEVDDYDDTTREGWSVLVVGRAELVRDLDVTFKVLQTKLAPYANGFRPNVVRIAAEFISGRRIVRD